jgi:hypothetical protein
MEQNTSQKIEDYPERQAWRVREFCQAYRISSSSFWKYVGLGKIKTIKIGGRVLIPQAEAERISQEGI